MTTHLRYRPDIDGLRALAIIPVLLFHAGVPGFSGGYIGVDIFFVISGFLITSIIKREVLNGSFSFTDFWARRARRILPASVIMIICSMIAGWYLLAPPDYQDLGRSARYQAYFAGNFYFWGESGYFDNASELKPLLHMWSLAVEEQFYLIAPLVFLLCFRFVPNHAYLILFAMLLFSFMANVIFIEDYPAATFYLLHSRAWELLLGALLATKAGPIKHQIVANGITGSGFIIILICIMCYDDTTLFPGAAAALPTLATAAIIWGNTNHTTFLRTLLSFKPFVGIGLISYSLYLWHWPLIVFTKYRSIEGLTLLDSMGLIAASFIAGYLSWRFVETPFQRKRLLPDNRRMLAGGLASLMIIAIAGQTIRQTEGYPSRLPSHVVNYANGEIWGEVQQQCHRLGLAGIQKGELCEFGNAAKTTPALLSWGDSHAAALIPAMDYQAGKHGIHTVHASMSGCPSILGGEPKNNPECAVFNEKVLEYIQANNIKNVLLASRWSSYVYGQGRHNGDEVILTKEKDDPQDPEMAKVIFRTRLAETVNRLNAQGIHVWIVKQVPFQSPYNLPHDLVSRAMRNIDTSDVGISTHIHQQHQTFVNAVFDQLASENTTLVDPMDFMCRGGICPAQAEGYSLYRDNNHLSSSGSLAIKGLLEPVFLSIKHKSSGIKRKTSG
jgi:peptidoglycan/LPS O-acetylase OafA/YrhL